MTPSSSAVALDASAVELIEQTWSEIRRAGSFFGGRERLAFGDVARAARGNRASGLTMSAARTDAIRRVAADPGSIRSEMVGVWDAAGLSRLEYVELISVVVRVVAIDSYLLALGLPLPPLPPPKAGAAVAVVDSAAELTDAWVPTVGRAGATTALSALPDELAGVERLHSGLYLSFEQVGRYQEDPGGAISRAQMELVAARTSWLNECFY